MMELSEHRRSVLPRGALSLVAALAAAASTACSDSTGLAAGSASQIAFTTGGGASASSALASTIPVTKNGHTLDLTGVTVVVDRASLKRQLTDVCRSDDNDDEDDDHDGDREHNGMCGEVRVGPSIVDLPLDGKLVTLPGDAIPAGTFTQLGLRISLVRLQGTFDGKAFDTTVPVNATVSIKFDTPLVVTAATPTSITVNVPVDTWLVNADGSLIDPSKLTSTPSLMLLVKNHIATSLHAFEDRDHDGRDDHRGERHGDN